MIYDVTVPITNTMPVWPTDPPVQLLSKSHESQDKTHIISLTAITMGSHTGTHIDAPFPIPSLALCFAQQKYSDSRRFELKKSATRRVHNVRIATEPAGC